MKPEDFTKRDFNRAFVIVGEFLFHWAAMEARLNYLIGKLLRLDIQQEAIVTRNIQLRDKLAIAGACFDLIKPLTDDQKKRFRKTLNDIGDLSPDRNMCAHDAFVPSDDRKGVKFHKYHVRGKVTRGPVVIWDRKILQEKIAVTDRLFKELADIETAAKEAINLALLAELLSRPTVPLSALDLANPPLPLVQGILDSLAPITKQGTPPQTPQKPQR